MACCCLTNVSTAEVGVMQKCGKFSRLVEAGCGCYLWPWESMVGVVSLRIQEINVVLETKTLDNVFVTVHAQMRAYVFDTIRASLCHMTLDNAFESKEEISSQLKAHLQEVMSNYGFTIINALVTDLSPDIKVREAMNEINASKRLKEAAYQRAEGEKVVKVKRAEAEAESMYLSGVGVARQRKAIMDGLKDSIVQFSQNVPGTTAKDIMDLLVLTQYFDTLQEIGRNKDTKCVFLPNDNQPVRSGIMQAQAASNPMIRGDVSNLL